MTDIQYRIMSKLIHDGFTLHCIQAPTAARDVGRTVSIQKHHDDPRRIHSIQWERVTVATFDSFVRQKWIIPKWIPTGYITVFRVTTTGRRTFDAETLERG